MIRPLLPLALRLGFALICVGLGMSSYAFIHQAGSDSVAESGAALDTISALSHPLTEIALDAEPHRIAESTAPIDIAGALDGSYFILQADGQILRSTPRPDGEHTQTLYATLSDKQTDAKGGFSGLVLHPAFLDHTHPGYGRFYVIVSEHAGSARPDFVPEFGASKEDHQNVLYEYTAEDVNSNEFRGTRRELMRFMQPSFEHNMRGLAFDPEGYLYLGVGDGAATPVGLDSPSNNASSVSSAYGKVLRIDPLGSNSANGQYGIPETNPFRLVSDALPELWAFGLRAPESLSYDPYQRGLCIAENAHPNREEINLSRIGGEHFGWDLAESAASMNKADRARLSQIVTAPTVMIDRQSGLLARMVGSAVYRGESFPSLAGAIVFGSHDGQLLAVRKGGSGSDQISRIALGTFQKQPISALRQGPNGELLLLCENGGVYQIRKTEGLGKGKSSQRSLFCMISLPGQPQI